MKKFIGAICSGVAGICGLVVLALPVFAYSFLETSVTSSGYQLIANKATAKTGDYLTQGTDVFTNTDGYSMSKIFAILLLIASILLVLWAVVLLLKNLKIVKTKFNLNIVTNILMLAAVVFAVVMTIGLFTMAGDDGIKLLSATASPAIGAWILIVVEALACICGWLFARKNK